MFLNEYYNGYTNWFFYGKDLDLEQQVTGPETKDTDPDNINLVRHLVLILILSKTFLYHICSYLHPSVVRFREFLQYDVYLQY